MVNPSAATSLITALGQFSYPHRCAALGGLQIVGVVASPAALKRLPIQAFVVPASVAHDRSLHSLMGPQAGDMISALKGEKQPVLAKGDSNGPSFLFLPKLWDDPVRFALEVLADDGVKRVGFLKPLYLGATGRVDVDNWDPGLLVGGLLTYHQAEAQGGPSEILIPFRDEGQMRCFFERLESERERTTGPARFRITEEDPNREVVHAYLNERSLPSPRPPALIVPYLAISKIPFHKAGRRRQTDPAEPVDLQAPASGHVRLYSDALLDRAMAMVPEFVRIPDPQLLPAFVYARFSQQEIRVRRVRDAANRERRIGSFAPISESVFAVESDRTPKVSVVGEIGLQDLPRQDFEHSEILTHTFFATAFPFESAEFVRAMSGDRVVPSQVFEMIEARARRVEAFSFSTEQLDLMLIHQIVHECAEILWHVLPDSLRDLWIKNFPLYQEDETRGVYFRNLLRIYVEGEEANSAEFLASESFSDILALYWAHDLPEVLAALNEGLVAKHRSFFDDVMAWVAARREKEGSAFLREH
jgi:hypothetical protein